jgi:hypothetical protein
MTMHERYSGKEQVHAANGSGMPILNIGTSSISTPHQPLILKDVLHVPQATKSLLSVHKLSNDNNVSVEYHPHYFLVKDRASRKVLLRGPSEGGLYPIRRSNQANSPIKALSAVKHGRDRWHCRLGHPALPVVDQVLRNNSLPFSRESNKSSVCDACQQGKSHQLPFPRSSSVSHAPLELVYSDV